MANATASYDGSITNQTAQTGYLVVTSATVSVYAGTFAQVSSAGTYVAAAANGTNRNILGVFVRDVVTPTADTLVAVREGDCTFENLASDPVVIGDSGNKVYVTDDHTVCHTAGSNAVAGIFLRFDLATGKPVVRVSIATSR